VNRIQFDGSAVHADETIIRVKKQARIKARQRFMMTLLLEWLASRARSPGPGGTSFNPRELEGAA
jgi:hypothetical protein